MQCSRINLAPYRATDRRRAAVQRVMDPKFLTEAGLRISEAVEEIEDRFLHGLLRLRRRRVSRPRKKRRG
jgi:hypothetical protein